MAKLSGRRKEGLVDIDLNSLVDISFLLLMFFILATTFIKPAGERLNVPSGEAGKTGESDKSLTVHISGDGIKIDVSDTETKSVTLDELREKLLDEKFPTKPEAQRIVVLDASKTVVFQAYFEVIAAIAQSGGVLALLESDSEKGE